MNTDSQNQLASMVRMQPGAPALQEIAAPDLETAALSELADNTAVALQMLERDGRELSHALEARLDSLQESFMEILNKQLTEGKLRLEERLHLYLSPQGVLVVEGEDSDAEKLCELISANPVLRIAFRNWPDLLCSRAAWKWPDWRRTPCETRKIRWRIRFSVVTICASRGLSRISMYVELANCA